MLGTDNVPFEENAAPPADPTREGYTFTGWSPSYNNVTGNLTVTAQYAINTYTVRFFESDGTTQIGTTQTIDWSAAATLETAPAIVGYTFSGWTLTGDDAGVTTSLGDVRENIDAVAAYTRIILTVTFTDFDGTVLGTDRVPYGNDATSPGDPTREGYTFTGWSPSYNNVTGAMTVTAEYRINTFTVTFEDFDGTVIDTQTVEWNTAATAPDDPERDDYTFAGWDVPFDNVTEDITVTAQYEAVETVQEEDVPAATVEDEEVPTTGANSGWLWWLLLLIPLAGLIWLIPRVDTEDRTYRGNGRRQR